MYVCVFKVCVVCVYVCVVCVSVCGVCVCLRCVWCVCVSMCGVCVCVVGVCMSVCRAVFVGCDSLFIITADL